MNTSRLAATICFFAIIINCHIASAKEDCPRTIGTDKAFSESWTQSETWIGSETLAVSLPEPGIWPTTAPGHRIAIKLFWYSVGFKSGMERDFVAWIERLDEGPNDAVISRPTNAGLENDVWTILTGIDFKSAGCWRIIGEFRGQSLEIVVETVE